MFWCTNSTCQYATWSIILSFTAAEIQTGIINTEWRRCTGYYMFYIDFICNIPFVLKFLFFNLEGCTRVVLVSWCSHCGADRCGPLCQNEGFSHIRPRAAEQLPHVVNHSVSTSEYDHHLACFSERAPAEKKNRVFSEGWIEFKDKKVAKQVALSLNNTQVGGKRRSKW